MDEAEESDLLFFVWRTSCRICLSPEAQFDIFDDSASNILSSIKTCLNPTIYKGDPMPEKVCLSCKDKLADFMNLKEISLRVEAELKKKLKCFISLRIVKKYFDQCDRVEEPKSNQNTPPLSTHEACESDRTDALGFIDSTFHSMAWSQSSNQSENSMPAVYNCSIKQEIQEPPMCENCDQLIFDVNTHACFKCDTCLTTFHNAIDLQDHACPALFPNRSSIILTPWKCQVCFVYFQQKTKLIEHYNIVHYNDSTFPCNYCYHRFPTKNDLCIHKSSHLHIQAKLTCDELVCCETCGTLFANSQRLTEHRKIHTKRFSCDECGIEFNSELSYTTHSLRIHRTNCKQSNQATIEQLTCNVCGKVFSTIPNVRRHLKTVHLFKNKPTSCSTDVERAMCRLCGYQCSSEVELRQHERLKHPNRSPFFCRKCSLRFATRSMLLIHLRTHKNSPKVASPPKLMTSPPSSVVSPALPPNTIASSSNLPPAAPTPPQLDNTPPAEPKVDARVSKRLVLGRYRCPSCPKVGHVPKNIIAHIKARHPGKLAVPIVLKNPIVLRERTYVSSPSSSSSSTRAAANSPSSSTLTANSPSSSNKFLAAMHDSPAKREVARKSTSGNNKMAYRSLNQTSIMDYSQVLPHANLNQTIIKEEPIENVADNSKNIDNLSCRYCNRICSTPYNLQQHESIHANKVKVYQCKQCPIKFYMKSLYVEHKKAHIPSSFHCQRCNKIFLKEYNLFQHDCPHDIPGRKAFKCPHCPGSYDTVRGLKFHIAVIHKKGKQTPVSTIDIYSDNNQIVSLVGNTFYCTNHDVELSTKEERDLHLKIEHPGGNWYVIPFNDKMFQCTVCRSVIDNPALAMCHMDDHKKTDETDTNDQQMFGPVRKRAFKCPFCNSTFSSEEKVYEHINSWHPEIDQRPSIQQRFSINKQEI